MKVGESFSLETRSGETLRTASTNPILDVSWASLDTLDVRLARANRLGTRYTLVARAPGVAYFHRQMTFRSGARLSTSGIPFCWIETMECVAVGWSATVGAEIRTRV